MDRKFSDQELIRRAKLKDLVDNQQDPFVISEVKRDMSL